MTNSKPTASDNEVRFPSLESLRAAHSELLKQSRADGGIQDMVPAIESFIMRGKATGALLDADADRWAAQSQLDYWATQLYQPGYEPPDATLDEFDPQLAPELDNALCPYVGLDAFHEGNQSVFFGREHLVRELIRKLKATRFLAVLGSSGSGKSSVVRAGLIPALKKGAMPRSEDWIYISPMVPGSNPLANLARLLSPDADATAIQSEADRFRQDPAYLAQTASQRFNNNLVLIVDQFEEVFTLCTDEVTRHRFVDNLIGLSKTVAGRHRVIITMRTDFEASIARLPGLQEIFEKGVVRVTPLSASELREAIEAPAALIGLKFEEGLVDTLLNDTLGEPAALPLLQFTLLKLWENRQRNRVTWEAYKKLGGGRQTLAHSADEFYDRLIPEDQVTMRRILLRMVRVSEGLEVTSNRVQRVALYEKAEAKDRIDRVLDKLIIARLVRVSEGDVAGDEQVEVAHEALVRNWPRLVEWLEEERVALRQRQRLTTSAEEWLRLGRDPSALWRGRLLEETRRYDDLSSLEKEFVEASYAAQRAELERTMNEARQQKELEYAKKLAETEKLRAEEQAQAAAKLRQGRAYLIGALVLVLLFGALVLAFSVQMATLANRNEEIAKTAQAASTLAVAHEATAHANADEAQRQARIASIKEIVAQSVALRDRNFPVSLLLAVEAFNLRDDVPTRGALKDDAYAKPQLQVFLRGHTDAVIDIAFNPDGRTLASGSLNSAIILWDVATGKAIGQPLSGHSDWITSVAFSPDGKTLASGSYDNTVILWDMETGPSMVQRLSKHFGAINSIAFSPDGKTLASGSLDGTIILWDVATGEAIGQPLSGHSDSVFSVAYSPDGKTLASGSYDNTVILWNVELREAIGQPLSGHFGAINSIAFSPDGKTLVSGSSDRTIVLWDVESGEAIGQPLSGHSDSVNSVAFSPDGKTLASGSSDRTIVLWDVGSGEAIRQPLSGHSDSVNSIAFSPDGKTLASGSNDNTIILWDVESGEAIGQPLSGNSGWITSVAFSPDGKALASGYWNRTIILWDVESGEAIGQPLSGHTEPIIHIAFSPDGKTLASGSWDWTIILWDVESGEAIGQPLSEHTDLVSSVAFSPDGKMLASGSHDSTVILRDVDPLSWVRKTCNRVGRNLTQAEWTRYFPDEEYRKTCPQWPAEK